MAEEYVVTTAYSNLDTSMLNAIRLCIMQETECYHVHECKVANWQCVIPQEYLASNLSACPIVEEAARGLPEAGIAYRTVYRGSIECMWTAEGADDKGVVLVTSGYVSWHFTDEQLLNGGIRFVDDNIPLIALREGESIHMEIIASPSTAAQGNKYNPHCDPTSVVAIRDFDRPWLLVKSVASNSTVREDVITDRLLNARILYDNKKLPSRVIRGEIHNSSDGTKKVYAQELEFDSLHVITKTPPDACRYLCTLLPNDMLKVECEVMEPTRNVLIIETTGVYTVDQLLAGAMKRIRRKMFGV